MVDIKEVANKCRGTRSLDELSTILSDLTSSEISSLRKELGVKIVERKLKEVQAKGTEKDIYSFNYNAILFYVPFCVWNGELDKDTVKH